jgi:hypothetical protein
LTAIDHRIIVTFGAGRKDRLVAVADPGPEDTSMKVQDPTSLLQPPTQQKIGATLAAGETITVPTLSQSEVHQVRSYLGSPEGLALIAHLRSSVAEKPVLTLHSSAQQALETNGVALSPEHRDLYLLGGGTLLGAGVGILFQALGAVAGPHSQVAFTIGCAAIGLVGGAGLVAGGEISWAGAQCNIALPGNPTNPIPPPPKTVT